MRPIERFVGLAALAALGLSMTAAMAWAGGPLALDPNDPDGVLRWPGGGADIPFNLDRGGLGPQTEAEATADLLAAMAAWQDVPSATLTFADGGRMEFDVDRSNFAPFLENLFEGTNTSDGLSPVVFDQDGSIFASLFGTSGVLGFASPDTFDENGVPIEAVAFLNGGAVLDGFPLADFQGVEVHELGHYSALGHTVVNGQNVLFGDTSGPTPFNTYDDAPPDQVETMFPFIAVGGGQVTLHADDVAFLSFLYPAPGFFAASGTISGTIVASDGSTLLTGVNVIARNILNPFADAVSGISGDRGVAGEYSLHGLTPGASYTVQVDQITR